MYAKLPGETKVLTNKLAFAGHEKNQPNAKKVNKMMYE